MEKIHLEGEDGEKLELYLLETTRLMGENYILASDVEQGDGNCYILKVLQQFQMHIEKYIVKIKLDTRLKTVRKLM